jgi:hypothetical protein
MQYILKLKDDCRHLNSSLKDKESRNGRRSFGGDNGMILALREGVPRLSRPRTNKNKIIEHSRPLFASLQHPLTTLPCAEVEQFLHLAPASKDRLGAAGDEVGPETVGKIFLSIDNPKGVLREPG